MKSGYMGGYADIWKEETKIRRWADEGRIYD
jgi:hypothetical protein